MPSSSSRDPLAGAVSVVTGASSGLGRRLALDLSRREAVVVAIARRRERLESLVAQMRETSPKSSFVVCDVTDTDRYRAVLGEVEATHGRIDILVNNAGIPEPDEDGLGSARRVMETNFFAPVAGTLAVLPGMRTRRRGAIVNVSSDSGRAPTPGEPAYSASKAAISAFTEALSFEVEGEGVRLHVLYPGWVPTEMTRPPGAVETRLPPRIVRRTDAQVSALVLRQIGGARVDIDGARIARLAPVARALLPRLYRRGVRAAAAPRR